MLKRRIQANRQILLSILLTLSAIFATSFATAAGRPVNYEALQDLRKKQKQVLSDANTETPAVTQTEFQKHIDELEEAAMQYFWSAKITAKKIKNEPLDLTELKSSLGSPTRNIYELTGFASGDENSSFLRSLQAIQTPGTPHLTIRFDPLFGLVGIAAAQYNNEDISMTFSARALTLRLQGDVDFVGHEGEHHVQHQKVLDGEKSLARLRQRGGAPGAIYDKGLNWDEIEAYSYEFRFWRDLSPKYRDEFLATTGESATELDARIEHSKAETLGYLEELIKREKETIRILLDNKDYKYMQSMHGQPANTTNFMIPIGDNWATMSFNHTGLKFNRGELEPLMREHFSWMQTRIQEIENEISLVKETCNIKLIGK